MIPGIRRAKFLIASRWKLIFGIFVLIGVVSLAGAAWAYTHPPIEHRTEQTNVQTFSAETNTSAVVAGNTSLWAPGTRLQNRPIYPIAAPNLTVTTRTTVPSGQSVHVNQALTLVYEASRGETVFWQRQEPIAQTNVTTSSGGVTSTATLHIPGIRATVDRIEADITGLGTATASLQLTVRYETDRYTGTLSAIAPLEITHTGYWLSEPLGSSTTRSERVTNRVTKPPDPWVYGPLTVVGFLGLVGALVVWRLGSRSLDPSTAYHHLNQSRYGEWISEGRVDRPISAQRIAMASLADLVDVAIDSHRRVVYDPDRDLYALVDQNAFYYFDPNDDHDQASVPGDSTPPASGVTQSPPDTDAEKLHGEQAWEELLQDD